MSTDTIERSFIEQDFSATLSQIGRWSILATSGGRRHAEGNALILPVNYGHSVRIRLAANDTYSVEHIFRRGGREWVKREWHDVYAEDLGDVVYRAGCYLDMEA